MVDFLDAWLGADQADDGAAPVPYGAMAVPEPETAAIGAGR